MPMQTVQVRLTPDQVKSIDGKVKQGVYQSRSEAIRDFIRKAEFFDALNQFRKLAQDAGLSEEEVFQGNETFRKKVFEKFFVQPT